MQLCLYCFSPFRLATLFLVRLRFVIFCRYHSTVSSHCYATETTWQTRCLKLFYGKYPSSIQFHEAKIKTEKRNTLRWHLSFGSIGANAFCAPLRILSLCSMTRKIVPLFFQNQCYERSHSIHPLRLNLLRVVCEYLPNTFLRRKTNWKYV